MKLGQYLAELGRLRLAGSKRRPIDPAQGADQGVAVLSAYLALLVAMAAVYAHLSPSWIFAR
jgi:hypothetical protein